MKCCICGKKIKGNGNNPEPLVDFIKNKKFMPTDRCCNDCNYNFVVYYRISELQNDYRSMLIIASKVYCLEKEACLSTMEEK